MVWQKRRMRAYTGAMLAAWCVALLASGAVRAQDPTCPTNSLFSHPPHGPNDPWAGATSDLNSPQHFKVYENYSGLSGEIDGIRFWGLKLYYSGGWFPCDGENVMTFMVEFYPDDGGIPAATPVCSYQVDLAEKDTGVTYDGDSLFEYNAVLTPACNLAAGWVAVQGISLGQPIDCWFVWMSSPVGDGISLQWNGTGLVGTGKDRAVCLSGAQGPPTGACCLAGYACSVRSAADCAAAGGRYQGDGTSCTPTPCYCRGDANCDGQIDFADIDPFVAALSGGTPCHFENCDVNGDGRIDFGDIDPFVALLSSGATCP